MRAKIESAKLSYDLPVIRFDGLVFAAFCDSRSEQTRVMVERNVRNHKASRQEYAAIFIAGVRMGGKDINLIQHLRSGATKTITLALADRLLLRYHIFLSEFEQWAEHNDMVAISDRRRRT